MLAYAPRPTGRAGSPRTLLLVAAGHVVALALVLTARSEFAERERQDPTDVIFVEPIKPPPPPPPRRPPPTRQPTQSTIDRPTVIVPTPAPTIEPLVQGPPVTTIDPVIGNGVVPQPRARCPQPGPRSSARRRASSPPPTSSARPTRIEAPRSRKRPACASSLAIDARGRVTSVTPVGAADRGFLDAARRHIVRHWRYRPASEGGDAVASTIVVTLDLHARGVGRQAGLAMLLAPPYLGRMSVLPPMVNPRAAMSDFAAAIGGDSKRDRLLGLTLAVLVTTIIIIIFFVDAKINTAPPPRVTYVELYAPDRTDADIIAAQKIDSEKRARLPRAEEARVPGHPEAPQH